MNSHKNRSKIIALSIILQTSLLVSGMIKFGGAVDECHTAAGIIVKNCVASLRIALVNPTFTAAAYNHAFYDFYKKHNVEIYRGNKVSSDLNLMTGNIPDNSTVTPLNQFLYNFKLVDHIKRLLPSAIINVITDSEVHNGYIFKKKNVNRYDIIMIFHEEYVTAKEYQNFKRFVLNGGVLMALSGNMFYGEVKYNPGNQTVTLVKGHGFEFDGDSVKLGIAERWQNETQQWLGSNFYRFALADYVIRLYNNPFNYTGIENNFASNPKDKIILNYESSDTRFPIATHELDYGKGKVIATGIGSENVLRNPEFLKFFDDLLVNHAIMPNKRDTTNPIVAPYKQQLTNTVQKSIISKKDLQFTPWGGNANHMNISSVYNGTTGIQIFRMAGNTSNGTAGFASTMFDHKGKQLSVTIGDVLKYGNFSNPSKEFQVSFNFEITGSHDKYHLVFVHGAFYPEGWHDKTYYQKMRSHSSKLIDLDTILTPFNDTFLSMGKLVIAVAPHTVLNPMEFRIGFNSG